nr:MAG TPA: hypothetical protein [Caudoviricetes sp.]
MIRFEEVKSVEITRENIEDAASWLDAKLLYFYKDGLVDTKTNEPKDPEPFLMLPTTRGNLIVELGDHIHMDGLNRVKIVRTHPLKLIGKKPRPKDKVTKRDLEQVKKVYDAIQDAD